jgi:GNAT superfamily N-acetyltransferase
MRERLMHALARHAGLRLFRLFSRKVEDGVWKAPAGLRLLDVHAVMALCGEAELDLAADRVASAFRRGDLCVAAFDGEQLSGYCWLAFAPLPHLDGAWVDFEPEAVWTYKSYVRPAHRGRRIAAALYRFADAECRARGRSRSIICVESHNGPSVTAARAAGYRGAGWAGYLRRPNGVQGWYSPQARALKVRFYDPGQQT